MVESVRVGTVIAHDRKALRQWQNRHHRGAQRSRSLSPEQLEAAVTNLASMFPGNVSRGIMGPA